MAVSSGLPAPDEPILDFWRTGIVLPMDDDPLRARVRDAIADGLNPDRLAGMDAVLDRIMAAIRADRIIDQARVQQDADGQYHVQALSSNNEIVLWSEAYGDRDWAVRVASDLGVPVQVVETA